MNYPNYPLEPTYENYKTLDHHEWALKADAYICGGLRGGYELDGWFYTIVRGSIIVEPCLRLRWHYTDKALHRNHQADQEAT